MTEKKLIAIDLDGTALNSDSKLSKKTIQSLKRVSEKGHFVSIVTGRPYRLAIDFYRELSLTTPMVNFNGGLIVLPEKDWAGERQAQIERELVFEILARKHEYDLNFIAAENKDHFYVDNFHYMEPTFFGAATFSEENLLTPMNMRIKPNSMLVSASSEENKHSVASELRKDYGDLLDVNPWGGPNPILELVPKGIHKAHGVSEIADFLQIKKENIFAFGDELNDLQMIIEAGCGIAMKNANEEVKAVADDITRFTNDEDGLADYLENELGF
ncbi:hypothetical protein SAMN02745116_00622 [Pilibacter termitis]|uniref:Haloacid dehalogenase-like hydrolase n=1 Tax=Pilibacter termitis TaxID=263852 RepID=A0A1T4LCS5_9ENTE|nr:Cof-type HAD-IIB family hydrolase [Pilibacter termitis]SJZ52505.1 hypothetical protein SAMN02745116_00622 [Pilibacter termitis]